MLFNSFEYLLFLPIVFLLYWYVFNKSVRLQNLFVVVVSYIFYGWWNWHFLLLIAFTTICSYLSGLAIMRDRQIGGGKSKLFAWANVIINLVILGIYKYYNFFVESFMEAFASLGVTLEMSTLRLVLPVGISFYTFQALSYTIDVYKQKIQPPKDVVAFVAFISFFPQLVAGPIERATNLLPQFLKQRKFNYSKAVDGMKQILWGLFKKMVIADNCADFVNSIWANYSTHSSGVLMLAAVLFAFQIYGDFSGYSDIAIGSARLFGINLMRNFNFPYFSRNVSEFWKRWHISLNTWFVDYIYIPLGGSRRGQLIKLRNTFAIFLLSGLWHGANWTFVLWGLYHSLLFVPLMVLGKAKGYSTQIAEGSLFPSFREAASIFVTFFLVVIGWIIFRADNVTQFFDYMGCIASHIMQKDSTGIPKYTLAYILIMLCMEWFNRSKQYGLQFHLPSRWMRWSLYILLSIVILTQAGNQAQFIYFQF